MTKLPPDLPEFTIEEMRRSSSDLDTNCTQIFTKGTALTRDFLEKIEDGSIGPKRTKLFHRNIRTRQLWVLSGLNMLFLSSCLLSFLMTFTDLFDTYLLSHMLLINTTTSFAMWQKLAVPTFLKVHIFNYTNLDEFEKGLAPKLRVEDIGPFVYEETLERVNVKYHQNGTVTYQDHRTHRFRADLSQGRRQSDRVVVPNMPLLGAAAMSKHSFYMTRLAMSTLLRGLNAEPFLQLPAHRFIWGYDDNLYNLARGVLAFKKQMPFERFGILASRNGTSKDVITINSGVFDIDEVGQIDKFNGQDHVNFWSTEECNRIKGSDGTVFPPNSARFKKNVHVYYKDLCRSFTFKFDREVKILNEKISAYKYVLPDSVFDTPENVPENQCFCDMDSGECAPQGVFNATPCAFGAPAFISLPHFHKAAAKIKSFVTGLEPKPIEHESFIYLHPKMGFPMAGKTRLQMNVQVKKSDGIFQLNKFENDMMLPVAWVDIGVDDKYLPEVMREEIYKASIAAPRLEALLVYGSFLTAAVTLAAIFILARAIERETRP